MEYVYFPWFSLYPCQQSLQPYGRNWTFLWSVEIPKWQIALLVVTFFVGVWTVMLLVLTHFSKTHTWLLPVFAVGLGAPRWCQVSIHQLSVCDAVANSCLDVMGHFVPGIVYPMGWLWWALSWHFSMVVVGRTRRRARCWLGNDLATGDTSLSKLSCVCSSLG